jgi:hypothetical protein
MTFNQARQTMLRERERIAREEEIELCAAIQEACPELSRGAAMVETVRILNKRRA